MPGFDPFVERLVPEAVLVPDQDAALLVPVAPGRCGSRGAPSTSRACTAGRCVCPWIMCRTPVSESMRETASGVTSMMSALLSRVAVRER